MARSEPCVCRICDDEFFGIGRLVHGELVKPDVCGKKDCIIRGAWGPEDWAGRARMAAARRHAGVPLDEHDRTALRKAGIE